jgi:hypothetical protein
LIRFKTFIEGAIMSKYSKVFAFLFIAAAFAACSTSHKKTAETTAPQEVAFSDSEVPYFQKVVTGGKASVVIVDPSSAKKKTN